MWQTADLGGLRLLRATLSEFAFRPHAHEEFFIALTERGLATPTYRRTTHVIGPGDLIVLNPEEAHAGGPRAEGSWTYRTLYPGPDLMRQIMAEFPGRRPTMPSFGGDVVRDREVAARLRRFQGLSEQPGSSMLEREAQLSQALVLLVGRHAAPPQAPRSPGRERRAVRRSREYLQEHAAENVTLAALARFAGLSAFHLCRVFGETVGMTPHAYQTQVRVRHAKSLLQTGLPIALVAAEAGFYDQAHLTRHFKRIVGLTPAGTPQRLIEWSDNHTVAKPLRRKGSTLERLVTSYREALYAGRHEMLLCREGQVRHLWHPPRDASRSHNTAPGLLKSRRC